MTDTIGGEPGAETQPDGAPSPVAAGPTDGPPEYLANGLEKFWDGDAKSLKGEDLARSYREVQSLIGRRVGDLSPAARKQLAESLPDEMRATWSSEIKAALAEDQEFLGPLIEKALAEKLPKAPEAYMAPEGADIDIEHPAFAKAAEIATKAGMSQDAFNELIGVAVELLAPYEGPLSYDVPALKEAIGPDVEQRAAAVGNRVRSLLGPDEGNVLLRSAMHPDAFLALERLVKATSEEPLPLEGDGAGQGQATEEQLRHDMLDPRYWNPAKRDPSFVARITEGFRKLHGDRI